MTPTTFEQFLTVQRYRPLTVRTYTTQIKRVLAQLAGGDEPLEGTRNAMKAYLKWLDHAHGTETAAEHALRTWFTVPRLRTRGQHKQTPVAAFTDDDWWQLVATLKTDPEPEGRVLEVQVATGLRIGDVLRLRRRAVLEALRSPSGELTCEVKGGHEQTVPVHAAADVWRRLADAWPVGADTVAAWVSPRAGDAQAAAYMQVRKHLRLLALDLGIEGRINLHRIRHTVADLALAESHDITHVSAMLGHKNVVTTQRYLDSRKRVADVSRITEALQRRRRDV